jgi:hypothetical protein
MSGPSGGPQVPPSKVRALARSRDGEDPGMSKSPVLARVQALPYAWLVARNSSQRVEPDVRPLKPRSLYIYCREDAPPATTLTGDVPSQHLMCPVHSAGRRRQGHPADGVPVYWQTVRPCRLAHCARHPFYKKLTLHTEDMQISDVRAQEDCPSSKHL